MRSFFACKKPDSAEKGLKGLAHGIRDARQDTEHRAGQGGGSVAVFTVQILSERKGRFDFGVRALVASVRHYRERALLVVVLTYYRYEHDSIGIDWIKPEVSRKENADHKQMGTIRG